QACAGGRVSAESGRGLQAATAAECSAPGLRGGAAAPLVGARESGRRRFEWRYGQPDREKCVLVRATVRGARAGAVGGSTLRLWPGCGGLGRGGAFRDPAASFGEGPSLC